MLLKLPKFLKNSAIRALKRNVFKATVGSEFILASNRYGQYCIPASHAHRPAAKCLMAGNVWEPETVEFMISHCKTGDVVTAGAWAGDSLPALSLVTAQHGTVWAFEPNPESFRCAAITVLLNDLKNVKLLNAGLGEKSETRHLVVRDFAGLALGGACQIIDIVDSDGKRGAEAVPINIVAIDDIVPSTGAVSILQLDIEGFEEFALAGAVKTIARCRPFLILETVPKPESTAGQFLESLNYHVTRRLDSENVLLECG